MSFLVWVLFGLMFLIWLTTRKLPKNSSIKFPEPEDPERRPIGAIRKIKIWRGWEHNGWGNMISWYALEGREVVGWLTPLPMKGDELHDKMKGGKIARFRFTDVRPSGNPPDMFFATVKDIGYLEEATK